MKQDDLADEIARRLAVTEHSRCRSPHSTDEEPFVTVTALHRTKARLAIRIIDQLRTDTLESTQSRRGSYHGLD